MYVLSSYLYHHINMLDIYIYIHMYLAYCVKVNNTACASLILKYIKYGIRSDMTMFGTPPIRVRKWGIQFGRPGFCGSPCHATVRVVTFGFQEAVISFSLWIHHHSRLKKSSLHQTSYCFFFDQQTSCLGPHIPITQQISSSTSWMRIFRRHLSGFFG